MYGRYTGVFLFENIYNYNIFCLTSLYKITHIKIIQLLDHLKILKIKELPQIKK